MTEKFVINFNAGANGGISATVDGAAIASGAQVEKNKVVIFTATPNAGYRVDSWNGATPNASDPTRASLVVSAAATVSVSFMLIPPKFAVTFNAGTNGGISATVDGAAIASGAQVEKNKTVTFIATPDLGYMVDTWTGAAPTASDYSKASLVVTADATVSVSFKVVAATTRYVKAGGTGDGSSWAQAGSLDAVLAAASAYTEVWVAAGTYKPSVKIAATDSAGNPSTDRDRAFVLKKDVQLYGGFAGVETARDQRKPDLNITILSGDFNSDDTLTGSGASLAIANNGENAYHVLVSAGDVGSACMDGFTITGGKANGGGSGGPMVNGVKVERDKGGGISLWQSSPAITHCSVKGNFGGIGGGMTTDTSSPVVRGTLFHYNYSDQWGGAVYNNVDSNSVFIHCRFEGNYSRDSGGAVFNYNASKPVFAGCLFKGNAGKNGGAVNDSAAAVSTIINSVLYDNKATAQGGALRAGGNAVITNCIVLGNTAPTDPGIVIYGTSSVITYNLVQGAAGGANGNLDGTSITAATVFTDPAAGDFSLKAGSPAIHAGNSADWNSSSWGSLDLAGAARIVGSAIDLGPYEKQ